MSEDNKIAIPDGPFTLEMKVALILFNKNDDQDWQVAEVTCSLSKGQVPSPESLIDLTKRSLEKVRGSFPEHNVQLLSRSQYSNYVVTGSPEMHFTIRGPDDYSLDFGEGNVSEANLFVDEDEEEFYE